MSSFPSETPIAPSFIFSPVKHYVTLPYERVVFKSIVGLQNVTLGGLLLEALTSKMLTESELAIFQASQLSERALNTQQFFSLVGLSIINRKLRDPNNPVKANPKLVGLPDELADQIIKFSVNYESFNAIETRNLFFTLHQTLGWDLPSYPRVQRYLKRFEKAGWLEKRQFGKKKNSWVYWISKPALEVLNKEKAFNRLV